MITRRGFLRLVKRVFLAGAAVTVYGVIVEPFFRMRVTRYALTPPGWPPGFRVRLAVVADIHACEPWMDADRIRSIVQTTNALEPDCTLLLGDYVATHRFQTPLAPEAWARELDGLRAPLGVYAVLGNHDWWSDQAAIRARSGPTWVHRAFAQTRVKLHENDAVRLEKGGRPFWLAGLGDQIAFLQAVGWGGGKRGDDDLPGTLAKITDDAPVVLMAHEPDIFVRMPSRVSLTLCGHTHGGQARFLGWAPLVPSRYGQRYVYGHIVENDRHMIVSGGLGCSGVPARIGSPPEIVVVDLGA